jgi:hypothetical protein
MHQGKYIFSQVIEFLPHHQFHSCVNKYQGNKGVRGFSCWQQFLCMSFGQLTHRESLRDVVICLNAQESRLYHLGFGSKVSKSTLASSNENRNWRIYRDLAQILIREARKLYLNNEEFDLSVDNTIYALDSTTIDLCLNIFKWAKFRKKKGAIKLHTLLDLRGNIPTFIEITNGKVNDMNILDLIEFEVGAFYIMDRGYLDYGRLYKIYLSSAFFVIRAKKNLQFERIYSRKVDKQSEVKCDQIIRFTGFYAHKNYPDKLRRIKYYDKESKKYYVFLTNNFILEAKVIADLYKHRWQIEIFFKWIKQHLKIKSFWGESRNAVCVQIWIAVCTYVLVAILKKKLMTKRSLNEILQILSISPFDKTPLNELLDSSQIQSISSKSPKQLKLLDI